MPSSLQDLPIYGLDKLAGSSLYIPNTLQTLIAPHYQIIEMLWWMTYYGTLTYLVSAYILVPLLTPAQRKK